MSDRKADADLGAIMADILQAQAFMFSEPGLIEDCEMPEEGAVEVAIGFSGPASGTLELLCGLDFSRELAANSLGAEPEDIEDDDEAIDAVKELLNVVCGRFLTEKYGDGAVFHLEIPRARPSAAGAWEGMRGRSGTACLEAEFHNVLASVDLEEE